MERSIDTILQNFDERVSTKMPISPDEWVTAAQFITVLMGDETDKLYELQQKVAQVKVVYIEEGDSVAKAKAKVEASDEYKEMCRQKAKIERIEEFIRVSKLRARLLQDEIRGQW